MEDYGIYELVVAIWHNRKRNSDVNNEIYQSVRSKNQNDGSIVRKKQKNELLDLVQLRSFQLISD